MKVTYSPYLTYDVPNNREICNFNPFFDQNFNKDHVLHVICVYVCSTHFNAKTFHPKYSIEFRVHITRRLETIDFQAAVENRTLAFAEQWRAFLITHNQSPLGYLWTQRSRDLSVTWRTSTIVSNNCRKSSQLTLSPLFLCCRFA